MSDKNGNGQHGIARTKAKRVVFRVSWNARLKEWVVKGNGRCYYWRTKAAAIEDGIFAAAYLHDLGALTQLVIHNKDGKIAEERTYGADPVRRKG